MSTRSLIGILYDDYTIEYVYCHWDGYLTFNGRILKEHYSTVDKVKELISHGSMSSLGETIEDCQFYHRDHGEELYENDKTISVNKFIDVRDGDEYKYLFDAKNNQWLYLKTREMRSFTKL